MTKAELSKLLSKVEQIRDSQGNKPTAFIRDGRLFVSAEDGGYFADYYGEFRGGYPWIHENLENLAKSEGMYWEWENPGCISLCD